MMLQQRPGFPKLVSDERIKDAIDILLSMQNASGGCSSYEPTRGSEYLEYLNAAEVFGRALPVLSVPLEHPVVLGQPDPSNGASVLLFR